MLTAIVVGVFGVLAALGGAWVGARLSNKAARQGWLFQRRAEVFERFLLALEKSREELAHYLRSAAGREPSVIEGDSIDLFEPAFAQARVARLYLRKASKERFEQLVREIRALQANPRLGDQRHDTIIKKAEELQSLLESHLEIPVGEM